MKSKLSYFRATLVCACFAALAVAASAQTTGSSTGGSTGFDFTTALTSAQTNLTSVFTTNGTLIFGILVVALGFGIVWRLLKRAAKSV